MCSYIFFLNSLIKNFIDISIVIVFTHAPPSLFSGYLCEVTCGLPLCLICPDLSILVLVIVTWTIVIDSEYQSTVVLMWYQCHVLFFSLYHYKQHYCIRYSLTPSHQTLLPVLPYVTPQLYPLLPSLSPRVTTYLQYMSFGYIWFKTLVVHSSQDWFVDNAEV